MLPDPYLDQMDRRRLAARWRRRVGPRTGERILVADRGEVIAGFAALSPSMREPGFAGEITMLYVRPELEGSGVGTQLLAAGLDQLAAVPLYWAIIWVLEANARAIDFYRRRGFRLDGGRRIDRLGGAEVNVVRCATSLNPAIDYAALR
jgi:ribosomal protein S18 acetylase RimI-like enzyme